MDGKLQAYLRLTRPPNLLTAVSDIWAGAALSGYFLATGYAAAPLILLSLSSVFLYAGGVVMNDVYDAELDAAERPERPIPSGAVSKRSAAFLGLALLSLGIISAAFNGPAGGILALLVAIASLLYDSKTKPLAFWGPLNMGICRGLNLLLGMSVLSLPHFPAAWAAVIPVVYIAAVTLVSRGEVHGGKRAPIAAACMLYIFVILTVAAVAWRTGHFTTAGIFLALFAVFVFPPLLRALKTLAGKQVGKAVKAGVLGLILMNASWVAAGAGWQWALATALLLPLSMWIARQFAVT